MPSNTKRSAQMPANQTSNNPASKNTGSKQTPAGKTTSDAPGNAKAQASSERSSSANANHQAPTSGAATKSTEHQVLQPSGVNRKKQKRRNKQAARLAAERQLDEGSVSTSAAGQNGSDMHLGEVDNYVTADGGDGYYSDEDVHDRPNPEDNNVARGKSKKKKGKKGRSSGAVPEESSTSLSTPSATAAKPQVPPPPSLSNAALRSAHNVSKDRIWNTSTQEERENIKEFWLQLGEDERRSLVKVEKEAVLRKMKEQQKHSCSCTVCGRKRTAIEEELEVLYDAYYEELEQYANHNHAAFENGAPIGAPRRLYQPPLRSFERPPQHLHSPPHQARGKVQELPDDEEEDLEDDYDEEDEEDDEEEPYSEDELDDAARATRADFFAFGNSLTVKDGILTVADDLLKNDGKHFIDMMEQLAERRMQREEETQYAAASAAHQMHPAHNHGPPLDEEDYDDEEDEEYDSQEDEEYDDEMDSMTEEQRMEEGRRMFQIFAARMFEQRVLTAYREKVARERQQKLIEELEEENRADVEREAKKAREAQKKKDKKRLQKQAKEEEKARREAERAAEEAEKKALEAKKLEEQRQKKEEQRKKREAEKKAQEEERQRKEAERQKRQREERERQEELERKQREQKEREKKKREEAKKKEQDEREAKEKELQERKAKEERERKGREERERQQRETAEKEKAERESKERAKREDQQAAHAAAIQAAKRASTAGSSQPQPPPGLHHPSQGPNALHSPHFHVATPIIPKSTTPIRARQASQQGSHASSPHSQPAGTDAAQSSISPGGAAASQSSASSSTGVAKPVSQPPVLHHPQPSAPISPLDSTGRVPPASGPGTAQPMSGAVSSAPGLPQRYPPNQDMPSYPGGQYRSPDIPLPPGINPPRNALPGRGFTPESGHTGLPFHPHPHPPGYMSQGPRESGIPAHSRQASTSVERNPHEPQHHTAAISRPAPIQRPSSTTPAEHGKEETRGSQSDVDGLTARLGSSALLEDTDVPLSAGPSQQPIPIGAAAPGAPGSGRLGFGASPLFPDPLQPANNPGYPLGSSASGGTWGSQMPFGPPGFSSPSSWGAGPGLPSNAFGVGGPNRLHGSRPVAIRLMVSQACRQLTAASHADNASGFHDVNIVLQRVDQLNQHSEPQVTLREMLDICDTEGNAQNGGGSFVIKNEGPRTFVKFEPDVNGAPMGTARRGIVPGDIGSPVPANSGLAPGGIGVGSSSRQFHPS